jgi:nucleoside-diphosphate-sugar epimerase
VARILIVGGGCPGRRLAARLVDDGHAVRLTTRTEQRRAEVEAIGAECWIGTPDRLATMRGALEHVTVACWMLARADGDAEQVAALHGSRLEFFLGQAIDTTVRGLLYDASPGVVAPDVLAGGRRAFESLTALNAIPAVVLDAGADADSEAWITSAADAIDELLAGAAR